MYLLTKIECAEHWHHLHAIRREVLFDTGIMPFVYDENHPDDRKEGNTPYLLLLHGDPIGVSRLDKCGSVGVLRLVGIYPNLQRQGHGRALSNLVDHEAVSHGIVELRVNAFKDAIGFYERTGWTPAIWDTDELSRLEPGNTQMIKKIGAARP